MMREDERIALFDEVRVALAPVTTALEQLPYKVAEPALQSISDVLATISDPLGEYVGACHLCDESVFLKGVDDPQDDSESCDELGWAHRTCMDQLRKDSPELFRPVEDDPDFREPE